MKPFEWAAKRGDVLTGELEVVGATFLNARLHGLHFEVRPVF